MRNVLPTVVGLVAIGLPAAASETVYRVAGELTEAENLTFAVLNGRLLTSAPEPGDLPLPFTGTLTVNEDAGTAIFAFGGRFVSPTRSYTFDIETPNVFGGAALDHSSVSVADVFADFVFSLDISEATQSGSFSFVDPGRVPTSPPLDVSAIGVITSVEVEGLGNPADLAAPFGELDIADVTAFLSLFGAGDPAADLGAPFGSFDVGDVVAFLSFFGEGAS